MSIVHQVPYVSQFASPELAAEFVREDDPLPLAADPRWAVTGAACPEEYAWWARRLCGMACLSMALGARNIVAPGLVALAEECTTHGGYVRRADGGLDGLIYAPFATWVGDRFAVKAEVLPTLPIDQVVDAIGAGCLAMISVHPWVRWPDRRPPHRGGHLVLVVGVTTDTLVIHNPSGLPGSSQQYVHLTQTQLENTYAQRGIVIHP